MRYPLLLCLLLLSTQAPAATCVGDADSNLRLALADTTRRVLSTLDADLYRVYAAYGVGESVYGGTGFSGFSLTGHSVCAPGDEAPNPLETLLWGSEAHARLTGEWGIRVLVLDTFNSASAKDPSHPDAPSLEIMSYRHTGLGAFLTYGSAFELGAIRLVQRSASVPGEVDGWLISAAAYGVRSTVLLGDDDLESVGVGLSAVPIGPVRVGAGVRHLDDEGIQTAYLNLHDWKIAGQALGAFLSGDLEVELNTARLRSASTTLRISMDLVPPDPPEPEGASQPASAPVSSSQPASAPTSSSQPASAQALQPGPDIRFRFSAPFILSAFTGSRLKGSELFMGGGTGWEMGLYGRRAGFSIGGYAWINDPVAMDYAVDPRSTTVFTFMARLRLELGALKAVARGLRAPQMAR